MEIISKTAANGKHLVIRHVDGEFIATVDGAEVARQVSAGAWIPAKQLHVFAGRVGITRDEGQRMIDAERAYLASLTLEPNHADLVATYQGLIDEQADVYDRAHGRQDARAMDIRDSYDAKIAAAEQAIRDYDAAHPEETAARKAERDARVESNRWM